MYKTPGVDVIEGRERLVEQVGQARSGRSFSRCGQGAAQVAEEILTFKQLHGEVTQAIGRGAVVVDLDQVGVCMGGKEAEFLAGQG